MKETPNQPIKLLCVGLGGMGRHDWKGAAEVPEFQLVAGVDLDAESRTLFEEDTGAPTYDDFDEALGVVQAGAALIAAPDAYHAPYAIKALEAGLDVICEKPMAETLDDAHRMHDTAERSGRMLMIHHQLRWNPACRRIRKAVDDGEIGALHSVDYTMFVHSNACLKGYRSSLKHLMLRDLAIHHFDLIRYLTGSEVTNIYARSWPSNEEQQTIAASTNVSAILRMDGPIEVVYRSRMRSITEETRPRYKPYVELNGSKGALRLADDELCLHTHKGFAEKEPACRVATPKSGYCEPWQSFANAMITRTPTLTASADNLRSLAVLFAAIESADTGKAVDVRR